MKLPLVAGPRQQNNNMNVRNHALVKQKRQSCTGRDERTKIDRKNELSLNVPLCNDGGAGNQPVHCLYTHRNTAKLTIASSRHIQYVTLTKVNPCHYWFILCIWKGSVAIRSEKRFIFMNG